MSSTVAGILGTLGEPDPSKTGLYQPRSLLTVTLNSNRDHSTFRSSVFQSVRWDGRSFMVPSSEDHKGSRKQVMYVKRHWVPRHHSRLYKHVYYFIVLVPSGSSMGVQAGPGWK